MLTAYNKPPGAAYAYAYLRSPQAAAGLAKAATTATTASLLCHDVRKAKALRIPSGPVPSWRKGGGGPEIEN